MKTHTLPAIALILLTMTACSRIGISSQTPPRCTTGHEGAGEMILPTTKAITPAGTVVKVGGHPQTLALSPSGDLLLVMENGIFIPHGVRSLDPATGRTLGFDQRQNMFFGLAFDPGGKLAYASGGGDKILYQYVVTGTTIGIKDFLNLPGFVTGIAVSPGGTVFAALPYDNTVVAIDKASWTISRTFTAPSGITSLPWTMAITPDGSTLVVLNRGSGTAALIPLSGSGPVTVLPLGEPPTQINPAAIACDTTSKWCYIANANADSIAEVNVPGKKVSRTFSVASYPGAPYGSSPNALALSPDGKRLFVALDGENSVAVIDIATGRVTGKIPTAWYPSAVAVSPDGKRIYIANMKGNGQETRWPPSADTNNTIWAVWGSVSMMDIPDEATLSAGIQQVKNNNCFQALSDKDNYHEAFSKIKHIIYIMKENKNFDSYFGDTKPHGQEFPAKFSSFYGPRAVTPNQHAIADEFTLVPNFYCDAEVSVTGHKYAIGAAVTDFVERQMPLDYGGHKLPPGNNYADRPSAYPINRFLFDRIYQAGLSFSNFGEFMSWDHPELAKYEVTCSGCDITDVAKAQYFADQMLPYFEAQGSMPPLVYITMGQDHCPPCYYAMNDLAAGMVVEALSKSSFWKDSVVFITEDDPQPGWDHVNDHRMFLLAAGAHIKRGFVSEKRYSFPSIVRTMELILGFQPLSLHSGSALSLKELFTDTPDLTPYTSRPVVHNPSQWPTSVRQFKYMEKMWCDKYGGMFTQPHPLCTKHKYPGWRVDDD